MDRYGRNLVRARGVFAALLLFAPALMAQTLSIRLVEAHNRSTQVDASLNDVSATLKRNLNYTGFRQLASSTATLPTGNTRAMSGYKIAATGPANSCTVTISKGSKQLLRTQVSLKGSTPLIVGGFPANGGAHLFVLKRQ